MRPETADGSATVRVRVKVKGKGVARRGAVLWADDLPADDMEVSTQPAGEHTSEVPAALVADVAMEHAAEESGDHFAETLPMPMTEAAPLGHVTSEVPRGAARGATATALCSAAALQRLRWD